MKEQDNNELLLEHFKLVDDNKIQEISEEAQMQDEAIRKYII